MNNSSSHTVCSCVNTYIYTRARTIVMKNDAQKEEWDFQKGYESNIF